MCICICYSMFGIRCIWMQKLCFLLREIYMLTCSSKCFMTSNHILSKVLQFTDCINTQSSSDSSLVTSTILFPSSSSNFSLHFAYDQTTMFWVFCMWVTFQLQPTVTLLHCHHSLLRTSHLNYSRNLMHGHGRATSCSCFFL